VTLKTNYATFCQKATTQYFFFRLTYVVLRLGSRGVHQTQIWVVLINVWDPLK